MSAARVMLWGSMIGAVAVSGDDPECTFEFEQEFAASGIEVAPLMMPLAPGRRYRFPALAEPAFRGLPGMLADSLPDRFGNALIDAYLSRQGRPPGDMDPVESLCYIGRRGSGALEFEPATGPDPKDSHQVDVNELAGLAAEALADRQAFAVSLDDSRERALQEILRVGTSAGGARAKALIAWDPETGDVRSGQVDIGAGYEHWILKFDGVEDRTRDFGTSAGYGAVEYAYSLMAREAGISMAECDLLEEGGRRHFVTRRFDRPSRNEKLHMQSLAALAHLDFNQTGAHSYEQAFDVMARLGLRKREIEEQFRRMAFNVVARNQDDHVKNIAFLMDRGGAWSLSPAFDVTYAYSGKPNGNTSLHQMSINGKRDGFDRTDFKAVGGHAALRRDRPEEILDEVLSAVRRWPEIAASAGIPEERSSRIGSVHRLAILG